MSLVAIDLDGTLLERAWPAMGEWKPYAIEAVKALLADGHRVVVYTARLSPLDWDGQPREPGELFRQRQQIRNLLDDANLPEVGLEGKLAYHLLVDDRAMRFPQRKKAWRPMLTKIRAALEVR